MEKILWVRTEAKRKGGDEGLDEVNALLEQGWTVKHVAAAPVGDAYGLGQAFVVLVSPEQKEDAR